MITLTAEQAQQIEEALSELMDLMDGVREGDYKPDSFTNQPAEEALATIRAARAQEQEPVAWRIVSEDGVKLSDWIDGAPSEGQERWETAHGNAVQRAYAAPQPVQQKPVAFKFVRYVDGKEMAEGVTIEREKTLDAAIKKAVALCPNRDKTVLVYAAPVQEPVAERKAQVNELIKESARLIASISDEGDRYLTAIDTLRNAYRLGLKDAAPVRTKDLTDDEIAELWVEGSTLIEFARAVIAADREKNRA